ncbi:50S ribosomal protein L17 [Candidatus Saccharibacteria bacterium]|nr:50S ribosomal protein L17 [Candidatus Saccharibacteria bacterium]MCL1962659.1 50S ribosomal protein L17 [Candidatus Saccharibacteria bacterium]
MHRHGYKGRKFGRERDQRNALTRGLTRALIIHGQITTTVQKAKEIRPIAEKLITKAKVGDLSARRAVIATLGNDVATGHLLVDVVAKQITRDSGYLRIVKVDNRVGDNAEMARVEFVDEIKYGEKEDVVASVAKQSKPAKAGDRRADKSARDDKVSDTKGDK